ncbi:Aminodeoxychorismate synthase [Apiospora marii]|uniref:aminodeoxychorismate synthase n=1 Tax=Apiospora marii TaxID=335849 RepID=A0ABR1R2E9_9PEZI
MSRPRILFLDAYDSFSNNIVSLLTVLLDADVDVLSIDAPELAPASPGFHDALRQRLRHYHAVVCGPGPGSPTSPADVGLIKYIWELEDQHLLPVLGICLGFQSLAVSCGAGIGRLSTGLHGMIRVIDHRPDVSGDTTKGNIFHGVPPFKATLYHSLCADVGQDSVSDVDWATRRWATPSRTPDIVPLAWVDEKRPGFVERIFMGMRHASKPFWGLQYHPESICSEPAGHQVIKNWFSEATRWSASRGRMVEPTVSLPESGPTKPNLLSGPVLDPRGWEDHKRWLPSLDGPSKYSYTTISLPPHIEAPDIVEILQHGSQEHIILDSASARTKRIGLDVRGRYSIVALDVDEALRFEYQVGNKAVTIRVPSQGDAARQSVDLGTGSVWHILAEFLETRKVAIGSDDSPFVGGFMGFATYELGLECIDVNIVEKRQHSRPDLSFSWITKSIVIDHLEGTIRIQSLHSSPADAESWMEQTKDALQSSSLWTDGLRLNTDKIKDVDNLTPPITPTVTPPAPTIVAPEPDVYDAKVRQCQYFIAAGDSYELCLTDQTTIQRTKSPQEATGLNGLPPPTSSNNNHHSWAPPSATNKVPSAWQLYRTLRARQPAPFGSYLRLGGATLISSSPERFLEYTADGLCSMRPMKGTVRKSGAVATLAQAERILHVPKEEAENLMIVDLVRHDLHSVCGPGRVTVPQLLKVEEYASVFQMISVVEGRLPATASSSSDDNTKNGVDTTTTTTTTSPRRHHYTGLDVLAASLPPGSMTGAPKKRSCEILQGIEGAHHGGERSLYSGVVGYMDAAGRGDWSVTIRSLFRWDDETTMTTTQPDGGPETEVWRIGAGGAVTALSTPAGETEEMLVKLKGPLGIFSEQQQQQQPRS